MRPGSTPGTAEAIDHSLLDAPPPALRLLRTGSVARASRRDHFYWSELDRSPAYTIAGSGATGWREVAAQIVQSDAYAQQRDDVSTPGLATSFLCWAIVQETVGDLSNAGWAAACAAWGV